MKQRRTRALLTSLQAQAVSDGSAQEVHDAACEAGLRVTVDVHVAGRGADLRFEPLLVRRTVPRTLSDREGVTVRATLTPDGAWVGVRSHQTLCLALNTLTDENYPRGAEASYVRAHVTDALMALTDPCVEAQDYAMTHLEEAGVVAEILNAVNRDYALRAPGSPTTFKVHARYERLYAVNDYGLMLPHTLAELLERSVAAERRDSLLARVAMLDLRRDEPELVPAICARYGITDGEDDGKTTLLGTVTRLRREPDPRWRSEFEIALAAATGLTWEQANLTWPDDSFGNRLPLMRAVSSWAQVSGLSAEMGGIAVDVSWIDFSKPLTELMDVLHERAVTAARAGLSNASAP
jgi:hypothetical protein